MQAYILKWRVDLSGEQNSARPMSLEGSRKAGEGGLTCFDVRSVVNYVKAHVVSVSDYLFLFQSQWEVPCFRFIRLYVGNVGQYYSERKSPMNSLIMRSYRTLAALVYTQSARVPYNHCSV